jgi:protein-tyrosine kinase
VSAAPICENPANSAPTDALDQKLISDGKPTESEVRHIGTQSNSTLTVAETPVGLLSAADLRATTLPSEDVRPNLPVGLSGLSSALFAAHSPSSRQSEAMRTLRSQLMLRWFSKHRKSITVISSLAGDEASCLAANLAIAFAQSGERTLLIDANLRNPNQHLLFGLKCEIGLSTLLSGSCEAAETLSPVTSFDTLSVLCAGPVPSNPQELLSRVSFTRLVDTTPKAFDIIIIDTPPILEFADAQLIAARSGGCVLATRRNRTRMADIQRVHKQLAPSGARMVGAVIID